MAQSPIPYDEIDSEWLGILPLETLRELHHHLGGCLALSSPSCQDPREYFFEYATFSLKGRHVFIYVGIGGEIFTEELGDAEETETRMDVATAEEVFSSLGGVDEESLPLKVQHSRRWAWLSWEKYGNVSLEMLEGLKKIKFPPQTNIHYYSQRWSRGIHIPFSRTVIGDTVHTLEVYDPSLGPPKEVIHRSFPKSTRVARTVEGVKAYLTELCAKGL